MKSIKAFIFFILTTCTLYPTPSFLSRVRSDFTENMKNFCFSIPTIFVWLSARELLRDPKKQYETEQPKETQKKLSIKEEFIESAKIISASLFTTALFNFSTYRIANYNYPDNTFRNKVFKDNMKVGMVFAILNALAARVGSWPKITFQDFFDDTNIGNRGYLNFLGGIHLLQSALTIQEMREVSSKPEKEYSPIFKNVQDEPDKTVYKKLDPMGLWIGAYPTVLQEFYTGVIIMFSILHKRKCKK